LLIYKTIAHEPGLSNQWIRLWFVPHTIYPYSLDQVELPGKPARKRPKKMAMKYQRLKAAL
jgi:hypothetical protein